MKPLTQAEARQYSPMALAFLGDSVYEVMVREYLLRAANQPAAKLHDQKVQLVCAGFQAAAADRLLPVLTENETGVYKRGRNANNTVPRHTSAQDYHKATDWKPVRLSSSAGRTARLRAAGFFQRNKE
ncbi:MAG: Mini-ribonuclease 3 [Ruminococcus sp.]